MERQILTACQSQGKLSLKIATKRIGEVIPQHYEHSQQFARIDMILTEMGKAYRLWEVS